MGRPLSCDKSDTGGKVSAGYNFGNGFGLEATCASFGKLRASAAGVSTPLKPAALMIGGVFSVPLSNEWGMNVRLGAGGVKTKFEGALGTGRVTGSGTKTKVYGGLGLTYALNPSVTLELALDTTRRELDGDKGTLRLVSLGAKFAF